ncbi:MAG TPA: DUF6599 family protein [Terriglobales bacterium]|nr:DUF6599 family protein [Terriglobales bacterium]
MRLFRLLILIFVLAAGAAFAADTAVLPQSFSGWQRKGPAKSTTDAAVADPANAPVLKEYGFTEMDSATYVRDDGRKLAIKAARFDDASGTFGAYTFYYRPEMNREQIGDQGASFNERILFYRGNILVDAVFDRVTAMSAADLRELAGLLPRPVGNAGSLPPVLAYMPRRDYIANTEKYIEGPSALAQASAPLDAHLVDFSKGTEVVLGKYKVTGGEATLMVISYPTPQIAADRMKLIDANQLNTQQQTGVAPIVDAGPFYDKRSGPLLAIAAGPLSQSEARSLLSAVSYDADVTWNQNTFFDKKNNIGNLIVNVILLCGILVGLMLVAGMAFGGLRIAIRRLFPGKLIDRPEQVEFISLHLDEAVEVVDEAGHEHISSSIKAS